EASNNFTWCTGVYHIGRSAVWKDGVQSGQNISVQKCTKSRVFMLRHAFCPEWHSDNAIIP
ncbi:MAG TPA: hypothetical protein VFQ78_14745, partial [Candidatus Udaeobacter sp.]|nr:hypothetical protein [Candidatus Udaeobacter sp.]